MKIDLSGRSVLVTGASRGIGWALATGLANAGARVAVHYNRAQESAQHLAGALGRGARSFGADLSSVSACEDLMEKVIAHYGRLDALVCNAGIARLIPLDASTSDWHAAWTETMAVNLGATELLNRLAIRHFADNGGGRIINIASRAAFRGDTPEYMTYAASKGGVVALTRSIARGYGKHGIRAFVLAPGFVRTDMASDSVDRYGEAHIMGDISLETLTEPEDLAPLVCLLASGLADHATGATIDVNAGSYVH